MGNNAGSKPGADLKTLLDQMRAPGTNDGSIELAMAIASVSAKVTVTARPLKVTPPDLFELTFNDPHVGITNTQMEDVKSNLAHLLPDIADDIARIPDDAGAAIEDVQEFIRLALLKASRGDP
jgi:hypothetical protein